MFKISKWLVNLNIVVFVCLVSVCVYVCFVVLRQGWEGSQASLELLDSGSLHALISPQMGL